MDSEEETEAPLQLRRETKSHDQIRNLIGFWLLGLTNNFAYVIMLSAAHDVLKHEENTPNGTNITDFDNVLQENRSGKLVPECNQIGTGAILLADILPSLIIKLTAPWYMQALPYNVRVALVALLAAASFPVVALSHYVWLTLLGVALASAGAGLGEITFLSLTSHFDKNSVSTWSSGTGAAGVAGALSYAGLTAAGLSPRVTVLIMLVIPAILAASYFVLLVKPSLGDCTSSVNVERQQLLDDEPPLEIAVKDMSLRGRISLVQPLLKYMIPLGAVYFAEYFINQALFELIYFENIWLPTDQQYRWYQVTYQIGVLISRSSVNVVQIKNIWILAILQFLNVAILLLQIFFRFLPSLWLVLVLILFEGLLGGGAYVNTFYRITKEITNTDHREFSMGVASISDSAGIAVAGGVAIPVHNFICTL